MSRHGGRHVTQAVLVLSVVPYMLKTPDNPNGVDQAVFDTILTGLEQDRAHSLAGFFKMFFGEGLLSNR